MKKRKLLSRVLCLILCLCLAIELIPSEAYANTLKGIDKAVSSQDKPVKIKTGEEKVSKIPKENNNLNEIENEENDTPEILQELEDERSTRVKKFLMSDGSISAVSYGMDVNYKDKQGKWKEINNNFLYSKDTGEEGDFSGYKTKQGETKIKFSEIAGEDKLVHLEKDKYSVDFTMISSEDEENVFDEEENVPDDESTEELEDTEEIQATEAEESNTEKNTEDKPQEVTTEEVEEATTEYQEEVSTEDESKEILDKQNLEDIEDEQAALQDIESQNISETENEEDDFIDFQTINSKSDKKEEKNEKEANVEKSLITATAEEKSEIKSEESENFSENYEGIEQVPAIIKKGTIEGISNAKKSRTIQEEVDEEEQEDSYAVENVYTQLSYEGIQENVSLNYSLIGSSLKEDIIVEEPSETYEYRFLLSLGNLVPKQGKEGAIYLNDSKTGKNIYVIPAAYMTDSADNYSENVKMSLEETQEGQYILKIVPDEEWMNDPDRSYPVTIDPTLEKSTADSNDFVIRDVYVVEGDSSTYYPYGNTIAYIGHGASADAQTHRMFTEFRKLPQIPAGSVITGAKLYYYQQMYDPYSDTRTPFFYLDAKEVTAGLDWTNGVTWDSQPTYKNTVLDSQKISEETTGKYVGWDLTSVIKKKYEEGNDEKFAAVALVPDDEESISSVKYSALVRFYKATRSTNKPYVVINYRDSYGVEEYYSSQSQEIDSAGTVYVGDYSSQLTLEKMDYSNSSEAISFSLEHYYNSGLAGGNFGEVSAYTKDYSSMKIGNGWKLNAQQTIVEKKIGSTIYYIYTDGDGTEHYFYEDEEKAGTFVDEDNLGLSVTKNGSVYTMTDGDSTTTFNEGYLTSIKDSKENKICFAYGGKEYGSDNLWKPTQKSHQLTSIIQINKVDNKARKLVSLSYDENGYLTKITDKAGRITKYHYDGGELVKITHPDNTTVSYTYDNKHYLLSALDNESKYGVEYGWKKLGCRIIVNRIREFNNSGETKEYGSDVKVDGHDLQHTVYTSAGNDNNFDTSDDQISTYTFDYSGHTVNVCTKDVQGNVLGVDTGAYKSKSAKNSLTASATSGKQAYSEIVNGGIEVAGATSIDINSWNVSGSTTNGSVSATNKQAHNGDRSIALSGESTDNSYVRAYAAGRTLSPGTYTFSAYVKTTDVKKFGKDGGVFLQFHTGSKVLAQGDSLDYQTLEDTDNGWTRISVTKKFTSSRKVYGFVNLKNAQGVAYVDDLQMEKVNSASGYNLLNNGAGVTQARWDMNTEGTSFAQEEKLYASNALKITGKLQENRNISQTVRINHKIKQQSYMLSGWAKAESVPDIAEDNSDGENRFFGLHAKFLYADGSYETEYIPFNADVPTWQYISGVVTPTQTGKVLSAIIVGCDYTFNANTAYFDGISLVEEEASLYDYDSKGNLISAIDGDGKFVYDYDDKGNIISVTDEDGNKTNFKYDESGNLEGISANEFSVKEDDEGTEQKNIIEGKDGTKSTSSIKYTADGNYISSETDAAGAVTSYQYDDKTDLLKTTVDSNKNTTSYTYNSGNSQLSKAALKDKNGEELVSLNYTYSNGIMSSLKRSGYREDKAIQQEYSFGYNKWKQVTSISAGKYKLAGYEYAGKNGSLTQLTYGNGVKETYKYDTLGQLASISYDGTVTYKYTYTTDGNIETVTDVPNDYTYTYKYDKNRDAIEYVKKKAGVTEIYSQSWESTDGLTSGNKISFDGKSYDTSITKDSQTSNVLTEKNILGNKQSFIYDSLGQKLSEKNNVYKLDYSYESIDTDNAKDNATGRIQQISYGKINNSFSDFSLKYEYDTLGRIVKVSDTKGNILAQYSYDAQGQLLMEKLPQQNKRYEYTYDTVGNIQDAKTYTLTGTTATATKKYTYGDASWNDLLTAYDGKEITYDGAGNPLAYNNGTAWKFTWEKGRELSSASADGKNITFTYDVDGIRDSKTINGVKHEYVTLDGLIYQEKWGNNTLTFSYDNNDKPYAVKYNNTTYYYVLNQQGDVIRIVDENGTTKAEYTYDAWGNVIASTGTDSGIGAVNPLLYRGYYYDSELGMYYLRSRYYDPGVKRFINADSVDYLGENKTELSYNLFAYCENNPIIYIDKDGYAVAHIVGGAIGGLSGVALGKFLAKKLKLHGTKKTALIAASAVGGVVLGAFLGPYVAQLSKYGIQLIKKNISYGAAAGKALCFVSGTLILTEEGLVPIEKLREGDYVYAEDINTGEQELKEIIQIYENQTQEVVCLKLKGEEIITTPYHPIYIDGRGWVAAVKVKNGDVLHTFDGKKILVEKVQYRKLEKPVKVYNFEVRDFHTYYVGKNNFLVHNKNCSLVKLSDKYIKKTLKLDAHAIKREYLGKKAAIARYDLAVDKNTGIIYIINKAGTIIDKTIYRTK